MPLKTDATEPIKIAWAGATVRGAFAACDVASTAGLHGLQWWACRDSYEAVTWLAIFAVGRIDLLHE